jgi:hypothetical protein
MDFEDGSVGGSCEPSNEPWVSIQGPKYFDQINHCQILGIDIVP